MSDDRDDFYAELGDTESTEEGFSTEFSMGDALDALESLMGLEYEYGKGFRSGHETIDSPVFEVEDEEDREYLHSFFTEVFKSSAVARARPDHNDEETEATVVWRELVSATIALTSTVAEWSSIRTSREIDELKARIEELEKRLDSIAN